MARILGIDIPNNKRVIISLTYIFGIGKATAKKILVEAQIDENQRVQDLSEAQIAQIREVASKYATEGDLRRKVAFNIKRLMEINSYRGQRLRKSLPSRGQRTKNNSRTSKGPRKTVANKKKAA